MKKVEIYRTNHRMEPELAATCEVLETGEVKCAPAPGNGANIVFVDNLVKLGIRDSKSNTPLYPKHGLMFLEELKHNFNSGYMYAKEYDTVVAS